MGRGDFILHVFKRGDPGVEALWPELPGDVVAGTRARYIEAFERLTEVSFDDYLAGPEVVLA